MTLAHMNMKLTLLDARQAIRLQGIDKLNAQLSMPPSGSKETELRAAKRWSRMLLRLRMRTIWHWQGIRLWMVQRPFLRGLPIPLPSTSSVTAWEEQAIDMAHRGAWPRRWLQLCQDKFTVFHLKECVHLRQRACGCPFWKTTSR